MGSKKECSEAQGGPQIAMSKAEYLAMTGDWINRLAEDAKQAAESNDGEPQPWGEVVLLPKVEEPPTSTILQLVAAKDTSQPEVCVILSRRLGGEWSTGRLIGVCIDEEKAKEEAKSLQNKTNVWEYGVFRYIGHTQHTHSVDFLSKE